MKLSYKALFIIPLIAFPAISYCQKTTHHLAFQIVNLTESNSGKTLIVSQGRVITLTLANKFDGGYRFDTAQFDSSVLRLQKHVETSPVDKNRFGNPGQDFWQFTALKKGTTVLKITASRPWTRAGTTTVFSNIIMVK